MSNTAPKYKFYPSLLDKYKRYLLSEADAEDFANVDAEGNYRLTPDQISEKREEELLACVNRVKSATTEAQALGTAFNEIIDCLVNHRKSSREDVVINSVKECHETRVRTISDGVDNMNDRVVEERIDTPAYINAQVENFVFKFNIADCKAAAEYFAGCLPQYYCKANLQTKYGVVELYGYADELHRNKVYDIKTTSKYSFGKYENGTQKDLYPYCLIESGEMTECASFEYTVYVPSGGTSRTPLISFTQYKEVYDYNHEKATARLRELCEGLIEWLEAHRALITDKKIFGGENE